ncbi:MAG: hypothetical protein ACRDG5_10405 [Anaerolineales bacterium]
MARSGPYRTLAGLALLSSATLAYEFALTRAFAVQQFHHFAFLVVSLAVMGLAAGGLAVSLRPVARSAQETAWPSPTLGLGLAASMVAAFLALNFLPFDSYAVAWDRRQVAVLLVYFLASATPLFFSGWATAAALAAAARQAHRPYAASLIGGAAGVLIAVAVAPLGVEATFFLAAALASLGGLTWSERPRDRWGSAVLALVLFGTALRLPAALGLRLSPYKPLSTYRLAQGARTVLVRWSAFSRLDAVAAPSIHIYPGLALSADLPLPSQTALFLDGDGPIPVTDLAPDSPQAAALAGHMPSSLVYTLRPGSVALVLQAAGGLEPLTALASGAGRVDWARDEPAVTDALGGPLASAAADLLAHPFLQLLPSGTRSALRSEETYDAVVFALSDPFRPVAGGAFSLGESYAFTLEALRDAWRRLGPDGLLVVTRWLSTPPAESVRAWVTLLEALEAEGLAHPEDHLVVYRGMRTSTAIASRQPFTGAELAAVRSFLEANRFDPIHLPDLRSEELNRFNQLPVDEPRRLFAALLADRETAVSGYEFQIRPATDDRPFFFHFFRWRQTPQVLATLGTTWQPFGGSGYLVLLALLGLTLIIGLPLIVAPLIVGRLGQPPGASWLLHFAFLGAAFLFVEVALLQKMALLLERPSISFAVVIPALLLASGAGSLASPRVPRRRGLTFAAATVLALAVMLPAAIDASLGAAFPIRVIVTAALIAIPGFVMGLPFAAGLRALERHSPGWIPWAWAINGAVSGAAGVLAALIALDLGITFVFGLGGACYLGALVTARE